MKVLLDKFTEKALKSVINSQEEARRLSHSKITTDHLLLGLMTEGSGIPVRVLRAVGVTLEALRSQVKRNLSTDPSVNAKASVTFSDQAITALKGATDKAKSLGYIYVGSEHILISLLQDDSFGAVNVLKQLDVDIDRIKDTVKRITLKRSLNRAHPEIQSSKGLAEISKAVRSKIYEMPFVIEDDVTLELMNLSKEEMKASGNDTIGTEHLLLAMAKVEDSPMKILLDKEGIDYNKIIEYLSFFQDRSSENVGTEYQLTPVSYKALETAYEISSTLGYGSVKPEHIMLGMLKEEKGLVQEILNKYSVSPKELYKKIFEPIEKQRPATLSIIKLSKEEARKLSYNVVGTEHILLGLLCVGMGLASKVLNDLDVTLPHARQAVKKLVGYGSDVNLKEMSFTPRAKRLLELAWEEAKKMNEPSIESEHLLLAIIRLKDSMAMKVLDSLGVDSIEITQGIMTLLENKKQKELENNSSDD